jgi:hypothetical protein
MLPYLKVFKLPNGTVACAFVCMCVCVHTCSHLSLFFQGSRHLEVVKNFVNFLRLGTSNRDLFRRNALRWKNE